MASRSSGRTRHLRAISHTRSVLIMTVVHNPQDARIRQRQINALLAEGWKVTYVAPFGGFGLDVPPSQRSDLGRGNLRCINIARSSGRRRLPASRAARTVMRTLGQDHDVVLVHDPELLLAAAGLGIKNLIWDVHEDPAAALQVKSWMPKPLRRPVATAWRQAERMAERRHHLVLAEYSYQARFRRRHPVVANSVSVPRRVVPAGGDRVSYLGSVTISRGCKTMIEVGRQLRRQTNGAVRLEVIGEAADAEARVALQKAAATGDVCWLGFVPNGEALARVSGSLAGLCLLRDMPNYRVSLPTKIMEYCAVGVPVITTPLPLAAKLVRSESVGFEVPWDDPTAVVEAILRLRAEPQLRWKMGANGHKVALQQYDWNRLSVNFVRLMNATASQQHGQTQDR